MKKTVLLILGLISISCLFAQDFDYQQSEQLAKHRLKGIKKMVNITAAQEDSLYLLCLQHQLAVDSALCFENDPVVYSDKCDNAAKEFEANFNRMLNNRQMTEYAQVRGNADVKRKTEEKITTLRESGEYSESELQKMQKEIFNYLMLEKVVYTRDRYDISKQKENIFRLKALEPVSLKEAESRRKMKHKGQSQDGKLQWRKDSLVKLDEVKLDEVKKETLKENLKKSSATLKK